jgi:hypothetical protein
MERPGKAGKKTEKYKVVKAEQNLRQPRLQRHQRRLVDIAERQPMAADEVVELVAEHAVPGVNGKQGHDGF